MRRLSPTTAQIYRKTVEGFAHHFRTSPEHLGPDHIREWLLYVANERKVSVSTLQMHSAALHFPYTKLRQLSRIGFNPGRLASWDKEKGSPERDAAAALFWRRRREIPLTR